MRSSGPGTRRGMRAGVRSESDEAKMRSRRSSMRGSCPGRDQKGSDGQGGRGEQRLREGIRGSEGVRAVRAKVIM